MDDESGESMELMEEVPLIRVDESELERGDVEKSEVDSRDEGKPYWKEREAVVQLL